MAVSEAVSAQVVHSADMVQPRGTVDARPRRRYTWTCQYCGQPFETEHYGQRYCNRTHREYAYRERVKQR